MVLVQDALALPRMILHLANCAAVTDATVLLEGENAFGLMAAEAGVHRLVRISPFDQAARRHTAFASVYVWPEIEDDVAVFVIRKT